jgi:hypothetical protein
MFPPAGAVPETTQYGHSRHLHFHKIEHIMNNMIMEAAMLDVAEQGSTRDGRGRFVPGMSGNPAGKAPGTRNRATMLKAALDSEDGPAIARIVIDRALAGDVVTAKFCLDRLEPKPRSRAIEIDLPAGARARDLVAAFDETVRAMAAGEITPDEAVQVTRVLDGRRKAIEAAWREAARTAPPSQPKPSPNLKPSPSGRGLGEGAGRTLDGAGIVSSRRPHPDPLPKGEGITKAFALNLLHSTCISRPCTLPGVPLPRFRGGGETAR